MKVYKADEQLDPLDQAYVQLRDALDADDAAGVQQALAQLTTLAMQAADSSATKSVQCDPYSAAIRQWYGK